MKSKNMIEQSVALKRVWQLTLPVLGEGLMTLGVGWSDTMLTARLLPEEKYLAAITVCGYLYWLIDCFGYVASIGAQAQIARFTGAGQPKQVNQTLEQALLIAGAIGILLSISIWYFAGAFVSLLPISTPAQELVVNYLRVLAISCPFLMVNQVACTAMQAVGHTFAAMCIMVLTNGVNIVLSWMLAIGFGILPTLGWTGIAIGTSVSFIVAGIVAFVWLQRGISYLRLFNALPKFNMTACLQILYIGVPGALNWFLTAVCYLWHLAIISRLGDAAVAAHGVAVWCESLSWLVGQAFSITAATLVGQALGANKPELARYYGWLTLRLGSLCMSLMGVVFFLGAPLLFELFLGDSHSQILAQGIPILQLVAFAQPAVAATTILNWALEGGAGDTRWTLANCLLVRLLIEIPLAYALTGLWLNLGLYGAWIALLISAYIQGTAAVLRFRYGQWTKLRAAQC